jgi:type I restriction enzyme S subunit
LTQNDTRDAAALPAGWLRTTVGEIYNVVGGGTPSTKVEEYWQGDIPWISSADIYGPKDIRPRRSITENAIRNSSTNVVPAGSLIVVTRVGLGKVALTPMSICFSQDSQGLIGSEDVILPDYAIYYLSQAVREFKHKSRGTTIAGVTKKQLLELPVVLPPLPEQHRIVAEIETQFTRLDAGVAALKRAQANLRRYKASVLKAACEGRLVPTEAELARAEGRDYEPADVLLQRILAKRRAKWEAENPGKKYKEPTAPDRSDLHELPEGWVWTGLDELTPHITSGSRGWAKYYSDTGSLFIRAQDINTDELVLDSVAHVALPESIEGARTRVFQDDLLVTITGANVTKTALVRQGLDEAYVSQHVGLVRPVLASTSPYLYYWIVSPAHGRRILEKDAYGAGKPGLNLTNLRELAVALPCLAEQQRIVAEVERRLSVVQELERQVEAALRRAERLRQSILKHAFEGKLVPQDPNDEPASVLLERISEQKP